MNKPSIVRASQRRSCLRSIFCCLSSHNTLFTPIINTRNSFTSVIIFLEKENPTFLNINLMINLRPLQTDSDSEQRSQWTLVVHRNTYPDRLALQISYFANRNTRIERHKLITLNSCSSIEHKSKSSIFTNFRSLQLKISKSPKDTIRYFWD